MRCADLVKVRSVVRLRFRLKNGIRHYVTSVVSVPPSSTFVIVRLVRLIATY